MNHIQVNQVLKVVVLYKKNLNRVMQFLRKEIQF